MPVLPSLYRHLSEHYFHSADNNLSARVLVNSFFAKKRGPKAMQSDTRSTDPATLKGYEELDDLGSQWVRKIPAKPAKAQSTVARHSH